MSWRYVAKRLTTLVVVMVLVSFATFLILELLPGDPAISIVGQENATEENLARVRAELRLDDPLLVRYASWIGGVVQGDFGTSYQTRQPVSTLIASAFPVTAELAVLGLVFSLLSFPMATLAVRFKGGFPDRLVNMTPLVLLAVPSFVLALLLIWVFSVGLDWFPATGWTRLTDDLSENLRSAFLPAVTLAAANIGVLTRVLYGEMSSTMQQDFVAVARSKGFPRTKVLLSHVVKPSVLPAVTVVGLQVGAMLAGAVIVETIFAIPGMGRLLVDSIYERDLITVQGVVLVLAFIYVGVNTLVDIMYGSLDPRTTIGDEGG